jgi:hypothetical protein
MNLIQEYGSFDAKMILLNPFHCKLHIGTRKNKEIGTGIFGTQGSLLILVVQS